MMSLIWTHMEAPPLSWMLRFRLLVKEVGELFALVTDPLSSKLIPASGKRS